MISAVSSNSFLGSCSTDAWRHSSIHCWRSFISPSSKTHSPPSRIPGSTNSSVSYFSATWAWGEARSWSFWREEEKICTTRNAVLLALSLLSIERTGNCILRTGIQNEMTSMCTIEYGSGNTDRRCGRGAVAECGHCEASFCSSCAKECCGELLCGYCYDFNGDSFMPEGFSA